MFFPGSSPLLRASSILFPCWRIGTSHGCARGLRLDSMQSASELSSPPSQCGQESNSGSCKPPQCVDEQPWDVKHQAEQHVGMYWKRREEKQDQLPQICAVPKQKLSPHRRGNRRIWYWLKRKREAAKCSFCGEVSGQVHLFSGAAGNLKCTGQCGYANDKVYPNEYQPPC